MRIAICDDNPNHLSTTKHLIEITLAGHPEPVQIHPFTPWQFLELLEKELFVFDIAILDIELDIDSNGIDLAKKINEKSARCQIIYLSNYPKYIMDVYESEHIYFVHKEKRTEILPAALEKAIKHLSDFKKRPFLFLNSCPDTIRLYLDDFIYAERLPRKTSLHTVTNQITITESISWLASECRNYPFLIRCHNSYFVNLKYVRMFNRNNLILCPGEAAIPISRRYLENTKAAFLQYMHDCTI